jgi:predicted nucleic acid-binding protein
MPISANRPDLLIDTSVAVALVVADHDHHVATVSALADRRPGLAGHAAFETFSVLTRLPPPLRLSPTAAAELLVRDFPASCFLGADAAQRLFAQLLSLRIAGGSIYDALVGATAVEHHLALASRDRRAIGTYQALQVDIELLT